MSIRMRLTLLYTAIVALTVVGFSAALYWFQARATLQTQQQQLMVTVERVDDLRLPPAPRDGPPMMVRRPASPDVIVQVSTMDGEIVERWPDSDVLTLPLSEAARKSAERGAVWSEVTTVEGAPLLIYTKPLLPAGRLVGVVQAARSVAERQAALATLERILLAGSFLIVLLAFGVGWVLSGLALRPINRITQTAEAIGGGQDLERRVEYVGPPDEVGRLATTFNRMLGDLQQAYQQIERTLWQQRQFLADVSHELRTPLTTIRGNLELARREPPISDEDRQAVLSDSVDESDRLIRLVNSLLMLARADARYPLRSEAVALGPLLEEVLGQTRRLAPGREVRLERGETTAAALGDPDALKQVLLALLDNALKHSTGAITLRVELRVAQVAIRVADVGPGIPPEALPHIFERFYRGDGARQEPGFGLGLAIAQGLVQAQGGDLMVESQEDVGSAFTVTLPAAP
ncbi:MAG: HAMP domain-containing protein [Chloroflexi bacterium]|nr:HAMP domain-containing protein [Chloroflexota bacterium]